MIVTPTIAIVAVLNLDFLLGQDLSVPRDPLTDLMAILSVLEFIVIHVLPILQEPAREGILDSLGLDAGSILFRFLSVATLGALPNKVYIIAALGPEGAR